MKILVIDDDKTVCDLLRLEFNDRGYQVETAENAGKGLDKLKNQKIDLVTLDIKMPGIDGLEALEKIVVLYKKPPVVICTAYSHYRESYLTWSSMAYIIKDGSLDELIETVERLLKP